MGLPIILVATKTDLRMDPSQSTVSSKYGAAVAKEIGAQYMECSAKTGAGVREVFNLALKVSTGCGCGPRREHRPLCVVI
jgi:Rho family protein